MGRFSHALAGLVLAGSALTAQPAVAHNWDRCGDGSAVRWPSTSTSQYYSSTMPTAYKTAIEAARTNFNVSDFDYYNASVTSALMAWGDYGSADTNLAGATYISVYCPTSRRIDAGNLYFNYAHFNAASHTASQYTCTAVHEMGHGAGFDHNTSFSILYADHSWRCHNQTITTLQTHDTGDINAAY